MGKTSLTLMWIQSQEPPRLSKMVIAAAIVAFLFAVSLLVYFFRRYKKTEKESQDDWELPDKSLFGPTLSASPDRKSTNGAFPSANIEPPLNSVTAPTSGLLEPETPIASRPERATREFESEARAPVRVEPTAPASTGGRATEVLSSEFAEREPTPASNEKRTELESVIDIDRPASEQPTSPATGTLGVDVPSPVVAKTESIVEPVEPVKPPAETEFLGARVDERPVREPFEPPRISPIDRREQWENPRIEELKPRALPETRAESRTKVLASMPATSREPASTTNADRAMPRAGVQVPIAAGLGSGGAIRARSGSVLGIPAESSGSPLVLGSPVKRTDELGIGALVNYGRDPEGVGGHGGTIALVVVVLLVTGASLAYWLVPSVNSRVNAMVARARGVDQNAVKSVEQPRARVFPARSEANKNMVKARGAVDNISEETLVDLKIEISLERGNDAPPEIRTYGVNPAELVPKQRGVFEFEYDGNRATGFRGYKITRLLSGGNEVKFTTPRQDAMAPPM